MELDRKADVTNAEQSRRTTYDIDPDFINRWSPRAFNAEPLPEKVLLTAFEAARWAPSGGNTQPWRFMYSHRGSETWPLFLECLAEGNRVWCKDASALLILLAKKDFMSKGQLTESSSYALDAGSAWMSFALQMFKMDWFTHGMAGIDKEKIVRDFEVPSNYCIMMMIAVGKRGDVGKLPAPLQAREKPNDRQPLDFLQSQGKFKSEWRNE